MKKTILLLTMLYSPSLLAATLTANNVPYVCQGGASPQVCNSNLVTFNNNIGIGTLNPGQALDVQGTIRATGFSGTWQLIATATPSSATNTTFNGLVPGVYYRVVYDLYQNSVVGGTDIRFNNDSGNNYHDSWLNNGYISGYAIRYEAGSSAMFNLSFYGQAANSAELCTIDFNTIPGNNNGVIGSGFCSINDVTMSYSSLTVSDYYLGSSPLSSISFPVEGGTYTGTIRLYQLN